MTSVRGTSTPSTGCPCCGGDPLQNGETCVGRSERPSWSPRPCGASWGAIPAGVRRIAALAGLRGRAARARARFRAGLAELRRPKLLVCGLP
jgi:hypothetical protein